MTTTIYEKSVEGRRAFVAPELDVPEDPEALPERFRRAEPPRLPEIAEPEIVRHYTQLSTRNFHVDKGFYPLGSCTMKHNPKLHERVAALPGHARLHPLQAPARAQGALQLMWELQAALAEIAGLPHVSLQPSAGSQGELAGVLLTRAYHEARGEDRHKVLTPDTAHGTNPATVTMAGYQVVKVGTADDGGVDLDDLRSKVDDDVASLMLTNPNTLGIFDRNIEEMAHDHARRRGDALLRRGEPQRRHGPRAAGRHGVRHRPLQPAQDLHPAARRRRAGRRADRGVRPDRAVPAAAAGRAARRRVVRPGLRPAAVDRPPARLPGQLRRLRALLRVHPVAGRRRARRGERHRGPERQLPDGAAAASCAASTSRSPSTARACTSSCSPAGR